MKHDRPTRCPRQQFRIDPAFSYDDNEVDSTPTPSSTAQAPPTVVNLTLGGADDDDATVVLWA